MRRCPSGLVLLAILIVGACGPTAGSPKAGSPSAGDGRASAAPATAAVPSPTAAITSSPTASAAADWTLVAFGDSWPYGAHCNGCEPFPELYVSGLEAATGRTIEFVDLITNGGTSKSLADDMAASSRVRDAIARADIIVISTGANDLESAGQAWTSGTCGGSDGLDCFRAVADGWHTNFDAMLTTIDELRGDRPTAVRLVTNSNEFLADKDLIDYFGADFGLREGAAITAMHHDALCKVASAHGRACVDLRPVLNGPTFDKPQDVNTQEAMQAVADALVASGVAELR